jgi:ADP-heptose:LPS heptosyltransferase
MSSSPSRELGGRFLVVAPQGLGDSLEATPALAALKQERPASRIDVAVLRAGARELFSGMPRFVDRVIYLPFWESGKRAFVLELLRNLRAARYDASFLMYPAARAEYQVLALALGAKRRYAHRYFEPSLRNLLGLNSVLVPIADAHNVDRNMDLLRAAGFAPAPAVGYEVPDDWRDPAPRRSDVLAVHVGNIDHDGLDSRRWPAEYFIETIRRMRARGLRVYVLAGPSEREVSRAVAQASGAEGLVELPLRDVARFMSTCAGVLANDSGMAHLAAGVGTPVMAIFGPTPTHFGPFGERTLSFRPSACPPCFDPRLLNTNCALDIDYACLKRDATVDRVEAALVAHLARSAAPAPRALQSPSQ